MSRNPDYGPLERELGALVKRLAETARLLPALTAENGFEERQRLTGLLRRGEMPVPQYSIRKRKVRREVWSALDRALELTPSHPAGSLYRARLEELELELTMMDALGDARRIRPLAARRFGTGKTEVRFEDGIVDLSNVAYGILENENCERETHQLPAEAPLAMPSLAELIRRMASYAGLDVEVRVEPRLVAAAATGEKVVFIANRRFGMREALRLAVHEVLGHLVSAANARAQPIRLLEAGCASAFADQEGVALWLEDQVGLMDGLRRRTIAARVIAADHMHRGASFGETARLLVRNYDFLPEEAVIIAERAYRGGGVARDVGYLLGWKRVSVAIARGAATIDELRMGRVSLEALESLRELQNRGVVRPPVFRPSARPEAIMLAFGAPATVANTVGASDEAHDLAATLDAAD